GAADHEPGRVGGGPHGGPADPALPPAAGGVCRPRADALSRSLNLSSFVAGQRPHSSTPDPRPRARGSSPIIPSGTRGAAWGPCRRRARTWRQGSPAPRQPSALVPLGGVSAWDIPSALLLEEKLDKAQVGSVSKVEMAIFTPPV